MTIPESIPIEQALKDCTADERKQIAAGAPPYDGVRTWGDLLIVRERLKDNK